MTRYDSVKRKERKLILERAMDINLRNVSTPCQNCIRYRFCPGLDSTMACSYFVDNR